MRLVGVYYSESETVHINIEETDAKRMSVGWIKKETT